MPTNHPVEHLALASAEEWADARPDLLPGIHTSLLTFTWSSHYPRDKVVCQAAGKSGACAPEQGVQDGKDISAW